MTKKKEKTMAMSTPCSMPMKSVDRKVMARITKSSRRTWRKHRRMVGSPRTSKERMVGSPRTSKERTHLVDKYKLADLDQTDDSHDDNGGQHSDREVLQDRGNGQQRDDDHHHCEHDL
jgi:hypothetical protein